MKKKSLTTAALSFVTVHAFAQGQILFSASPANGLIQFSTDGVNAIAYPAAGIPTFGVANVGFFVAPNATVLTLLPNGLPNFTINGWTAVGTVLPVGNHPSGDGTAFVNGLVLPSLPGGTTSSPVELEIVAWTGTATTWAAAVASSSTELLGFSGDTFNGATEGHLGWSQGTSSSVPATLVVTGPGGFSGITVKRTPEPSTFVLGGLGAAMLMLFRFFKKHKMQSAVR